MTADHDDISDTRQAALLVVAYTRGVLQSVLGVLHDAEATPTDWTASPTWIAVEQAYTQLGRALTLAGIKLPQPATDTFDFATCATLTSKNPGSIQ